MNEQRSFPLSWPAGWKRTQSHARRCSNFKKPGRNNYSMAEAAGRLGHELDLLGANKQILSTNVRTKLDGLPYSNQAQPTDPGAAVYFELKGRPVSLACDKWMRVEDNIIAIAKHVEALRGQERWGVGSVEQAFSGYMALPTVGESEASTWWQILGIPINSSPDQVREAYRILAKKHHPDMGGDPERFHRVQRAMERFEREQREAPAA